MTEHGDNVGITPKSFPEAPTASVKRSNSSLSVSGRMFSNGDSNSVVDSLMTLRDIIGLIQFLEHSFLPGLVWLAHPLWWSCEEHWANSNPLKKPNQTKYLISITIQNSETLKKSNKTKTLKTMICEFVVFPIKCVVFPLLIFTYSEGTLSAALSYLVFGYYSSFSNHRDSTLPLSEDSISWVSKESSWFVIRKIANSSFIEYICDFRYLNIRYFWNR